jgi:tetratricopeptide (TPR) repeat protein
MANYKRLGKSGSRLIGKAVPGNEDAVAIETGAAPESDKKKRRRTRRDVEAKANAQARPASERELEQRPDRLKKYLISHMDAFVFDEFSDAYLKRTGLADKMKGVPVPLRKEDIEAFKSAKGLAVNLITENMVRVMGIDPKFRYVSAYKSYIESFLGRHGVEFVCKEGKKEAEREEYDPACIHYRAALVMKPDDMAAMYGYARVCRAMYNESTDEQYIGDFKAESIEYFEMLTEIHPRYAYGWYYLGYMYLNMGLYQKAWLAWESFLPLPRNNPKDRKEIKQRMKQIKIPMEIERGYNAVLAGRWEDGVNILEPFTRSAYKDWWPLWYYLGEGYLNTGRRDEAKQAFTTALRFNAVHIESMKELIGIYEAEGDRRMVKKYSDKIELIESRK